MSLIRIAPLLCLTAVLSFSAKAQTAAITGWFSFVNDTANYANTSGFAFTVGDSDIEVLQLGFYDAGQDGLAATHDVAIYTTSGSVLASGTVASGTTGQLIGDFRYTDLVSGVTLSANTTYRLGAFTGGGDNFIYSPQATTTGSEISLAGHFYNGNTTSLMFPDNGSNFTYRLAGNFT